MGCAASTYCVDVATEMTAIEAAALLRPVDAIGVPLGPGQPIEFLHALGTRTDWEHLDVLCAMLVDFYDLPTRAGVRTLSTFYGPAERIYRDAGAHIEFIPADYRRWAPILDERRPRVMCTVGAEPDAEGFISLSCHAGSTTAALADAAADADRVVIVEISPHYPRTYGLGAEHRHRLHLDDVDVVIRSDRHPVELADPISGEIEAAIASAAQRFIHDGSTLQTGFGSIPTAVASVLAVGDGGDYGVHSEMFTTGLMRLHQADKVTNLQKGIFPDVSITTFAAGTTELYEWLNDEAGVAFVPVDVVNNPLTIAANRNMVTINGAIEVDMSGQVVADTIGGIQWSGIGGHEDFVSGGGRERDDRSLICMPSTSTVNGELVSRVTANLRTGAIVTTPRHQVDVVITEYGVAELRGRTTRERAAALAEIAHPKFRDELRATVSTRR